MVWKFLSLLFVQTALLASTSYSQDNFLETKEFAVGNNHACATTTAGIKCWGEAEQSTLKAPLDLITNPRAIAAGNRFTCMIVDEGVKCWGDLPESSKTDILIEHKDVNQPKVLSVGHNHACAISMEGKVRCWGEDLFGETNPPDSLQNATEISVGMNNSCAIANGKVVCWGLNTTGSTDVPEGLNNPRNLTSGWWHHCVATDDGIKCWGNPYKKETPAEVKNLTQFVSGDFYNCAIVPEGVKCWDQKGKINLVEESMGAYKVGIGTGVACALSPQKGMFCWKLYGENSYKLMRSYVPSGGIKEIKYIAAGNNSTCVYGDGGKIKCWGANPFGSTTVPDTIPGPVSSISHGSKRTCAVTNAQLSCWGDKDTYYDQPVNLGNISYISVGEYHVCAASPDKARCWGENEGGVFEVPKTVTNISKLSSGTFHSCAEANNEVVCWGGKTYVNGVNPPEPITYPRAICTGQFFSCAINAGGDVKCWGQQDKTPESTPEGGDGNSGGGNSGGGNSGGGNSGGGNSGGGNSGGGNSGGGNSGGGNSGGGNSGGGNSGGGNSGGGNSGGGNSGGGNSGGGDTGGGNSGGGNTGGGNSGGGNTGGGDTGGGNTGGGDTGGGNTGGGNSGGGNTGGGNPGGGDIPPGFLSTNNQNFASNFSYAPSVIRNATELVCGTAHACAVYEGKVKCWSTDGENLKVPEMVNPRQISGGANHTCALTDTGLKCWGGMFNIDMPDYSLAK